MEDLIGAIYDAVLYPERWVGVFTDIADRLRASSGSLLLADGDPATGHFLATARVDPEALATYQRCGAADPMVQRASRLPAGRLHPSHALVSDDELLGSELWDACYRHYDIFHILGGFALRDEERVALFGFQRPLAAGRFECQDEERLAVLWPHLRRAAALQVRLSLQESRIAALEGALDRVPAGAIVLDEAGGILFANRAAEDILRANDGLSLQHGGLAAATSDSTRQLAALTGAAAAGPGRLPAPHGAGGDKGNGREAPGEAGNGSAHAADAALALPRPSGKRPLLLLAGPLGPDGRDRDGRNSRTVGPTNTQARPTKR